MLLNFLRGGRALHLWEPTYILYNNKTAMGGGGAATELHLSCEKRSPAPSTPFLGFCYVPACNQTALPLVGYITIMVDWASKTNYLSIHGTNKVLPDWTYLSCLYDLAVMTAVRGVRNWIWLNPPLTAPVTAEEEVCNRQTRRYIHWMRSDRQEDTYTGCIQTVKKVCTLDAFRQTRR